MQYVGQAAGHCFPVGQLQCHQLGKERERVFQFTFYMVTRFLPVYGLDKRRKEVFPGLVQSLCGDELIQHPGDIGEVVFV